MHVWCFVLVFCKPPPKSVDCVAAILSGERRPTLLPTMHDAKKLKPLRTFRGNVGPPRQMNATEDMAPSPARATVNATEDMRLGRRFASQELEAFSWPLSLHSTHECLLLGPCPAPPRLKADQSSELKRITDDNACKCGSSMQVWTTHASVAQV